MEKKRALITGINGQDGSYLAEHLLDHGYLVHGLVRRASERNHDRIAHLLDEIELINGDLLDQTSLVSAVREVRPHEIYNLAAQSFVPASFSQPVLTGEFNGLGVTRLLDAVRIVDPEDPVLSGLLLGDVRQRRDRPAGRDDQVPAPQPLRCRQALRTLDHRQLSRVLRPVRRVGHSLQSRVPAPRKRVRHAEDHTVGRAHRRGTSEGSFAWETWTRGATGGTRATTSKPCG